MYPIGMRLPTLKAMSYHFHLTNNQFSNIFIPLLCAAAIIIYYTAHRTAAPCNRQPELSDVNISEHVFYEFYISGTVTVTEYNKDL